MPASAIEEFHDSPASRQELVEFLIHTGDVPELSGGWAARLSHWWDSNPCAREVPIRAWLARGKGGQISAFGGFIPAIYAYQGQPVPVLWATTLRVCDDQRQAGVALLLKMRRLAETWPIFHTTPIPKIQRLLEKMGTVAETSVQRRIFPMGMLRHLQALRPWPQLESGRRLTTDLREVRSLPRPFQQDQQLEKWITHETLRWYCASPMRPHHFIGAVDPQGALSSYLILAPKPVRQLSAWEIVESFSLEPDSREIWALAGELCRNPHLLPHGARLLTVASFASDRRWQGSPALLCRNQQVCHYFMLPAALMQVPKLTLMAEGDLGL